MGVTVEKTTMPAKTRTSAVTEIKPETKEVDHASARAAASRASPSTTRGAARSTKAGRAGCSTSTASRRSRSIRRKCKAGLQNFDVFILPDIDKEEIATGRRAGGEGSMKYVDELPPEYRGALEKDRRRRR